MRRYPGAETDGCGTATLAALEKRGKLHALVTRICGG